MDESTRAAMAGHRVVFLRVGLTDAASRVGLGSSRPLLLGNVRGTMKALLEERDTGLRSPSPSPRSSTPTGVRRTRWPRSSRRRSMAEPTVIGVADRRGRTTSWSGTTCSAALAGLLGDGRPAGRRGPPGGPARPSPTGCAASLEPAYDVLSVPVPAGERAKTAEVAAACWEALGRRRVHP